MRHEKKQFSLHLKISSYFVCHRSYSSASKKSVCSRLSSQKGWHCANDNGIGFLLRENFRSDLERLIRHCIDDV